MTEPQIYTIREDFIRRMGGVEALTKSTDDYSSIRADKTEDLADELVCLIADIVATLINAGSEREAVQENETLRQVILDELNSWTS